MKYLIVASHPNDEVLGCGGTIERLKRENHKIDIWILGRGRNDPLDNQFDKEPLLFWVANIESAIECFKPDIIFTHYEKDLNIDHQITYRAVITAARPLPGQCVKEIYSFEIPSSTEWAFPPSFSPNVFWQISRDDLNKKKEMMVEKYLREIREWPHPRSQLGIETLAMYRGMQCGVEYAEAFKCARRII